MATAPSPNDLTRQQLDELDALLQRMLSVPLAPADTPPPASTSTPAPRAEAPPLPPSWRVDPPAPPAGASAPHIALPEPPPVTLKFEPPVPPPTPAPAPKPAAAAPKAAAPAPAPKVAPAPAPKAVAPVTPAKPQAAPAPAPPVALPLLPLVAFNALFDSICGVFGPLGRLLRSGFFKHLYGLAGIGLLAYTAAHIAQKGGWLTLPFPLPWPR